MDFVDGLIVPDGLPVFVIGGIARAEIIDNCMLRFTLLRIPDPSAPGLYVPEVQHIWSIPAWYAAHGAFAQIAREIARRGIPIAPERVADPSLMRH